MAFVVRTSFYAWSRFLARKRDLGLLIMFLSVAPMAVVSVRGTRCQTVSLTPLYKLMDYKLMDMLVAPVLRTLGQRV